MSLAVMPQQHTEAVFQAIVSQAGVRGDFVDKKTFPPVGPAAP